MIQVSILVPTKNRPQFLSNILRNFLTRLSLTKYGTYYWRSSDCENGKINSY